MNRVILRVYFERGAACGERLIDESEGLGKIASFQFQLGEMLMRDRKIVCVFQVRLKRSCLVEGLRCLRDLILFEKQVAAEIPGKGLQRV